MSASRSAVSPSRAAASADAAMAIPAEFWLDLIDREYFCDFIAAGGAAVRVAVADAAVL